MRRAKIVHSTESILVVTPMANMPGSLVVQSSGESLELGLKESKHPLFTVIDSRGWIVRALTQWLSTMRSEIGLSRSQGTVEQYGRAVSYLARWLERHEDFEGMSVDEALRFFNRGHVTEWLRDMAATGAGDSSLHAREAAVRAFVEWSCTIDGGRLRAPENSPWGHEVRLKNVAKAPSPNSPKFIDEDFVVRLLSGFHNECERCMFHGQFDTGLRISELINLRRKDLPTDLALTSSYELIPLNVKGVKGRGGKLKERVTLISRAMLRRIKSYHNTPEYKFAVRWDVDAPDKPVFLTVNGRAWERRNAEKQFKNAVRRQGINDNAVTHWMRHGMAASVLRSDSRESQKDLLLMIQTMLGHSKPSTTEVYLQLSPALMSMLQSKAKKLNRLEEAENIRVRTFLAPLRHNEKRGHRG